MHVFFLSNVTPNCQEEGAHGKHIVYKCSLWCFGGLLPLANLKSQANCKEENRSSVRIRSRFTSCIHSDRNERINEKTKSNVLVNTADPAQQKIPERKALNGKLPTIREYINCKMAVARAQQANISSTYMEIES